MKKVLLASGIIVTILSGCGKSEAEKDYEACNEEYAQGVECTKEEFKDYLIGDFENNSEIVGGVDNLRPEVTMDELDKINDEIEEIFGE
ncbi:hypothetical protein [Heyndrickxia faecalis]|uniref:hypothetical protein n=1 Tax=Heyndrickxia faecalis TaxID=2824910 RepID=UPI003D1B437B